MKLKNYLFLSGIALIVAACSSNDDDNNREMTLKRVEEYYPSKAEYENAEQPGTTYKGVKYYENGEIVLDSFFDGAAGYYTRDIVQTNGNIKIKTCYGIDNNVRFSITYNYDATGRLLKKTYTDGLQTSIDVFSYETDSTISHTIQSPPNEPYLFSINVTNSEGLISNRLNAEGLPIYEITYENGNVMDAGTIYYEVAKPSNMRLNKTQSNNYILDNYASNLFEISKNYVKKVSKDKYESTFDESGYILHTYLSGQLGGPAIDTKEIFYYYN